MFNFDNNNLSLTSSLFVAFLSREATDFELELNSDDALKLIFSSESFSKNKFGYYCSGNYSDLKTDQSLIDAFYELILGRPVEKGFDYLQKILDCPTLFHLRIVLLRSREFSIRKRSILLKEFPPDIVNRVASVILLDRDSVGSQLSPAEFVEAIYQSSEFVSVRGLNSSVFHDEKSLLIVGFPKGVTSTIYQYAVKSLVGILSPSPADDGELFNPSRVNSLFDLSKFSVPFYSDSDAEYDFFEKMLNKFSSGFILKDVCYPFQIMKYLTLNPNKYNVICIDRDFSVLDSNYSRVGWDFMDLEKISRIKSLFNNYPVVNADEFLVSTNVLDESLAKCYPNCKPAINFDFSR